MNTDNKMQLAAQLFTVRDFLKTEKDIEKTLVQVKNIGYNSVQLSAMGEYRASWLGGLVKELNISVCATHSSFDRIVDHTEDIINEHKLLNCKYVGLGYYLQKTKDDTDILCNKIADAVEKIYDSGLKFLYHNHDFEFTLLDNKMTILEYLCTKFPPEKMGLLMDFYWVTHANFNCLEMIDKFADRLDVVHFKDMITNVDGTKDFAEVFEGCIDYESIYKKLLTANTQFVAVEQDKCAGDPFSSLKISYDNIKKHGLKFAQ